MSNQIEFVLSTMVLFIILHHDHHCSIIALHLPPDRLQLPPYWECDSYLQQLEDTIIAYNQLGRMMVADDFNSHIESSSKLESSTNIVGHAITYPTNWQVLFKTSPP